MLTCVPGHTYITIQKQLPGYWRSWGHASC